MAKRTHGKSGARKTAQRREPAAGLTHRERRFVEEYAALGFERAAVAAARVGYATPHVDATRLLKRDRVREAVELARTALVVRTNLRPDDVILGLRRLAESDLRDYVTWGPDGVKLRPSEELEAAQAAAVVEVGERLGKGGAKAFYIKLASKLDAYVALGKHLGLFVDKTSVTPMHLRAIFDGCYATLKRYVPEDQFDGAIAELRQAINERYLALSDLRGGAPEGHAA